jgi:hypothetical protein
MVVDRSYAVALFGLGGRGDHHLLTFRSPYRLESVGIQLRLNSSA